MAHRTPAPLRALGVLLRALAGLAVLAALVIGVPWLLLTVGHQPTELADGVDLTAQDDGTLFLVALTCIGWAGWAAFTFSALVEIVALLRRRSAPRIKGLGGLQSLASFLIGGIVLLAPTAASAATMSPAVAATTVHTVGQTSTSPSPETTLVASDESDWPQHTVTSTTELPWDLAEEYLGDGKRWKDIAALNPEIPQLVAGDQYLPKGAVIKLPADAHPTPPSTTAAPPQTQQPHTPEENREDAEPAQDESGSSTDGTTPERPASVTVQEGDNLWKIADKYGEPEEWPAIYEANEGKPTPDGGRFTNPDLIYPGQELALPQAKEAQPTADQSVTDPKTPDRTEDKQDPKPAPDTAPDKPAPTPATPSQTSPAPSTSDHATPDTQTSSETALAPAAVWAGAGALAAALVGTLTTRRILQQRRRRPGRRIPMPAGRAAATEQGLRAAQHPTGLDLLSTALRTLALNLAAADRDLPAINAAVLHDAKVELHLAEGTTPAEPFTTAPGRKDLWVCPASSPDLASEEDLKEADAPYPALVSIGWDGAGHLVLVDLEHVSILNLTGNADHARHVLQAIAVELASTPLTNHLEVTTLASTAPGLDAAAPERVAHVDDIADAITELTSHMEEQRRALAAVGAPGLRSARLMDDAAGAWTPLVLLANSLTESEHTPVASLFGALIKEPRTAAAVVTTVPSATPPSTAWTLDCQGPEHTIALPGSGLPVKLQGLSDEHFADAIELLTLAASDSDVAAPEWTRTEPDDPTPEEPAQQNGPGAEDAPASEGNSLSTDEDPDEDGLPAEYAELEHADAAPEHTPGSRTEGSQREKASAGPSLADVLAADHDENEAAPASSHVKTPGPVQAGADLAVAVPCTTPTAQAVHITIPSPGTDTDTTHPELSAEESPAILLLGPISIEGARGRLDSNRRNVCTELAVFLALNPGVDHHAIDEALWPGSLVNKNLRNAVISRTRSWLGRGADAQAHLPRVQETGDRLYRLGPAVSCDWTRFQRLARTGLTHHDEDGDLALRRALALVRGRPFAGISPQRYAWAEPAVQEMISAIVDVAYELSSRRREAGDLPGALWAARRGLLAAEESEMLHRQLFLAYHAAGDLDALSEAASRLARINEQLLGGVDMEAETAELLRNLLPRPTTRAR
ncbi:LysM peptidoglycan-binding domain-containing protein [Streptomyces sp. NPDC014646]|uniref:LysM peptidoglycan-binding domain-containing protein n=1 Tax=Streptomyces sp. NPDC014646 TaxID=3364877 RepID=UPI0036F962E7